MTRLNKRVRNKKYAYWRVVIVIATLFCIVFSLLTMLRWHPERFDNGALDLTREGDNPKEGITLSGKWEFYYGVLLNSEDFKSNIKMDNKGFVKVPGSWDESASQYPNQGVATYRMVLKYSKEIKDPAIRLSGVSRAYKLYVNGQLLSSIGNFEEEKEEVKDGVHVLIVSLPSDSQTAEIIIHVSNRNYAKGGLRESPIFGSKAVLESKRSRQMAYQLLFIGSVLIFGIHYLFLFILQRRDWASLVFSLICFVTGIRSLIWGEIPLFVFDPVVPYITLAYINYITGYNIIPLMLVFIALMYPLDYKKRSLAIVLAPTLFFNMLLFTTTMFMSHFTKYLYLLIIAQMVFMLFILIKAVLNYRENALLMFISVSLYILTINQDILHYSGLGGINANSVFLYGNIAVILALSYIQAMQHARTHKKLILYNENLLEADRLKDKIMATELSFLQAQIKPHFLYNALNAIANISEKNGKEAGKLIIDLAIYLRESLAFNNLEKRVSLEKELEFVDKYFSIEQARFGEKIKLVKIINCPLNFQIPVLILQPLVENAVRHGISKKVGGGSVTLNIEDNETETVFEIKDDGVGIHPEILKDLLTDSRLDQGIGLLNINSRLQRIYGCSLEITSAVEHGTLVKFCIQKNTL